MKNIIKIEEQSVERYYNRGETTVSVIKNIGIDQSGRKWLFYYDSWTEYEMRDGFYWGQFRAGMDYGHTEIY